MIVAQTYSQRERHCQSERKRLIQRPSAICIYNRYRDARTYRHIASERERERLPESEGDCQRERESG